MLCLLCNFLFCPIMTIGNGEQPRYRFGPFTLDPASRLLMQDDKPVALPPRAVDTLVALVENAGRLMSKEELLTAVWPDCFVEEGNLSQAIFQLRKALGESGAKQQYIETIPRRGYRFMADLHMTTSADEQITVTPEPAKVADAEPSPGLSASIRPDKTSDVEQADETQASEQTALHHEESSGTGKGKTIAWLILLTLIAGIVGWFGFRYRLPFFQTTRPSFTDVHFTRLTSSGTALLPALSPDGRYVAYVSGTSGQQGLWVQPLGSFDPVQLVPPADVVWRGVTFSRDGHFIYFVSQEKGKPVASLFKVPLVGGTPRKVLDDVDSPITFSPDGTRFVFVRRYPAQQEFALLEAATEGTGERRLVLRRAPQFLSLYGAAWSPDGSTIAYPGGEWSSGIRYERVMTLDVASGQEAALGQQRWAWLGQIAWDKEGTGVIFDGWERGAAVYADQLRYLSFPDGTLRKVTNDPLSYNYVSVASDSLVTTEAKRISRLQVGQATQAARTVESKSGFSEVYSEEFGLGWTPDGRIVYGSQAGGNPDIWIVNPDGSYRQQLTFDSAADLLPAATADGRYLVFVSQRAGQNNIWRMDMNGHNLRQLTNGAGESSFTLTSDGQWVIYSGDREGKRVLWRVPIEGGEPTLFLECDLLRPALSPDGKWVAGLFRENQIGRLRFALVSVNDSAAIRFFADRMMPLRGQYQWMPDSRGLCLIASRDGAGNLWLQPLNGSEPQPLTAFNEDRIFRFAWSPDGRQLACERGVHSTDIILLSNLR